MKLALSCERLLLVRLASALEFSFRRGLFFGLVVDFGSFLNRGLAVARFRVKVCLADVLEQVSGV